VSRKVHQVRSAWPILQNVVKASISIRLGILDVVVGIHQFVAAQFQGLGIFDETLIEFPNKLSNSTHILDDCAAASQILHLL
jgi:hypothetical protein